MENFSQLKNPVFIVSTGRSGSMMLARILAIHPDIFARHEPHPHLRTEAFVKWSTPERASLIERKLRKKREDIIKQTLINQLVYVESSHYTSHLIVELYKLYNAKFVHLYRDGRCFVRSALEKGWHEKESLKYQIKTWIRRRFLIDIGHPIVDQRLAPPRNLKTRFEKLTWLWVETNKSILSNLSSIPDKLKFFLPLEDFNEKILVDLHSFIGVPVYPETINKMLAIANQKPNKSEEFTVPSIADWSDWQKQRFNEIAGDMMHELEIRNF